MEMIIEEHFAIALRDCHPSAFVIVLSRYNFFEGEGDVLSVPEQYLLLSEC